MIPKKIHLCWFSGEDFPVEIKMCLDTWKALLPDYEIRVWNYDDAKAIGSAFINEALSMRKWAFAADVVRFYAVYTEGGVYMDSDIFLYKRFDSLIPEGGFATFNECTKKDEKIFGLQAAFFMGEKGNIFCKEMLEYYNSNSFINADGSLNDTICPFIMSEIAKRRGFVCEDKLQKLPGDILIYPTYYLSPSRHYSHSCDAIGVHWIYGNWRTRKLGRRIERAIKHCFTVVKYYFMRLFRRK